MEISKFGLILLDLKLLLIAIINPDTVVVLDSGLRLVLFKRKYVSDIYSHNANNTLFFQKYDESIFSLDLNGIPNW
jgi:hypothetical protein